MSKDLPAPAAPAKKPRTDARQPAAQGGTPASRVVPDTPAKSSPLPACTEDRDEAIRRMAYSLYEARGHVGGHEIEDWLRAEALVALASVKSPGLEQQGAAARRAPSRSTAIKSAASGGDAVKVAAVKPATAKPAAAKSAAGKAAGAKPAASKTAATKTASVRRATPKAGDT